MFVLCALFADLTMTSIGADLLSSTNAVLENCSKDHEEIVQLSDEEQEHAGGAPKDNELAVKQEHEVHLEACLEDTKDDNQHGERRAGPTWLPAGCSIEAGQGQGPPASIRRKLADPEDRYFLGYMPSNMSRRDKGKGGQSHTYTSKRKIAYARSM